MRRKEQKQLSWEQDNVTKAQYDYIKILSSYPSSSKLDIPVIEKFLKDHCRKDLCDLTKQEAHILIGLLLSNPCIYVLPCHTPISLPKKEANECNVLGEIMACMRYCPKQIDFQDCELFIDFMDKRNDEYEQDEIISKTIEMGGVLLGKKPILHPPSPPNDDDPNW